MGKKKHASTTIENLISLNKKLEKEVAEGRKQVELLRSQLQKAQNNKLIKQVTELRKQIEPLRLELASQTTEQDIIAEMERDVVRLVVSSTLAEATARGNAEIGAMMKKAESAAAQLNVVEMKLRSVNVEEDAIQKKMERIAEERNSILGYLEQRRKKAVNPLTSERCGRRWRKCIYLVVAAITPICVVASLLLL